MLNYVEPSVHELLILRQQESQQGYDRSNDTNDPDAAEFEGIMKGWPPSECEEPFVKFLLDVNE